MARFFTLTNSKKFNSFERRRTISVKKGAGPVSLKFFTIAVLAILTLLYLSVVNHSATSGYNLKAQNDEMTKIERQNQELEVEAARARAIKEIQNQTQNLGMVSVDKVNYE